MPRIRTIKPDFFLSEDLADLPVLARLLFIGLWTVADCEGRFEDRPRTLKAQLLPWEKCDLNALLDVLHDAKRIQRYEVDGERFGAVLNFRKHQRPHPKEPKSSLPAPAIPWASREKKRREINDAPAFPSTPARKGRERKGRSLGSGKGTESGVCEQVFAYWGEKFNHPRTVLDQERREILEERIAEGMDLAEGRAVVDGALVDAQSWPDRWKFSGIDYLFENRSAVEKFAGLAPRSVAQSQPEPDLAPPASEPWRSTWLGLRAHGVSRDNLARLLRLEQVSDGTELRLRAPDEFTRDWLAENMRGALSQAAGKPVRLEVST